MVSICQAAGTAAACASVDAGMQQLRVPTWFGLPMRWRLLMQCRKCNVAKTNADSTRCVSASDIGIEFETHTIIEPEPHRRGIYAKLRCAPVV
jgi:hypothetical protein